MKNSYIENRRQEVIDFLENGGFKDYEVDYILFNPNTKNIIMSASGKEDSSLEIILSENDKGNFECKQVSDWEFSIHEYIFSYLDNGYEIAEIKMPVHLTAWQALLDKYSENYYDNGVQKYLQYCKDNEITKEKVETVSDEKIEDIMFLYKYPKDTFIVGDEKVEMSREIFDERCNRFYWSFVLGQELADNVFSKYDKQPYDITYDYCYQIARDFINNDSCKMDKFTSIDILKDWISKNEDYIIETYEEYIGLDKKNNMVEEMER